MSKREKLFRLIPMGLFCLLALVFFLLPGYRFSALVCLGISAVLLLYYLFRRFPRPATRWMRIVLSCLLAAGMLLAAATGFLIVRAASGTPDAACDCVIVLGAAVHGRVPSLSLQERMDAALAYLSAHPDTLCVVSGGKGNDEDISEADCMYTWLTEKGIDKSRILREDRATSTQENLSFSMELLNANNIHPETVGIISSEYHLYRASLMARKQGINPVLIPAATTWLSLRINYFLREIVAVWYYTLLGG